MNWTSNRDCNPKIQEEIADVKERLRYYQRTHGNFCEGLE
jgi:hypothetical protein